MSKIRSKNTEPEITARKFLFSKGLRYRLHKKDLSGKPDVIFPKYRTVVQVQGCFWHKHEGCKYFSVPKTRTEWWMEKINKNVLNDKKTKKQLEELGWKVIIVWECELKKDKRKETLNKLYKEITCTN